MGLSLSNYFVGLAASGGFVEVRDHVASVGKFILFLLQIVAFTLLFSIIPHRPVHLPHALAGGVAAALLFELLRSGFALYVGSVDTYQRIYGALSAIPLFLLWLYLSWSVVLIGAEIAAALPEWRLADKATPRKALSNGERFSAALALLHELTLTERDGLPPEHDDLVKKLLGGAVGLDVATTDLQRARYLICLDDGRVVLTRDLGTVSLFDLQRDLGFDLDLDLDPRYRGGDAPTWAAKVSAIMDSVETENLRRMGISLRELFSACNIDKRDSDVSREA
jgi:membrane protein